MGCRMKNDISSTGCNCLTYEQRLKVLQAEFDLKSGLMCMAHKDAKEIELIHRSNEISIAKANRGVR